MTLKPGCVLLDVAIDENLLAILQEMGLTAQDMSRICERALRRYCTPKAATSEPILLLPSELELHKRGNRRVD